MPKNPRLFTRTAFETASKRLNPYNLNDLWAVSSLLSCIDYFDSLDDGFSCIFPMLSFEKLRMFDKAILASSARDYKQSMLDSENFAVVLNSLSNADYFEEFENKDQGSDKKLLSLISKIANTQFKFQNIEIGIFLARSLALFDIIPRRYRNEIQLKLKSHYVDIPEVFNEKFGLTIRDYLIISFSVFAKYSEYFNQFLKLPKDKRDSFIEFRTNEKSVDEQQSKVIKGIVDESIGFRNNLFFSPKNLQIKEHPIELNKITNFLKIISKSSKELSDLQYKELYRIGEIFQRLSPLERYPVIKTNSDKYIIPNIRTYLSSITNIIHFHFQDLYPNNEFNETFGSVFEFYIKDYIENCFPKMVMITERSYQKSRNRIDGPDFIIIDPVEKYMIVIEVKAKNIKLESRLAPMSDSLETDLERIFDALKKLPSKIEDMFSLIGDYSEYQTILNEIQQENVFCLLIIGQGIEFLPEIINFQIGDDTEHFLNDYPYKYAIVDTKEFEIAVELASQNKESLKDILLNFWKTAQKNEPHTFRAQQFEGRLPNAKRAYWKTFYDSLFSEFKLTTPPPQKIPSPPQKLA